MLRRQAPPASAAASVAAASAAVATLLAACAGWSSDPGLTVRVDSSLDRPVLVYVNGDWVGTLPARAGTSTVPAAGHGGPPWRVEARTSAGKVLLTLHVAAAESPSARAATLGCGTVGLAAGGAPAASPAMADPPLPCD